MENIDNLIGLTLEQFKELVDKNAIVRLMREDNNHYFGTCDFHPDRYNLELDNGLITKVYFG